VEIASVFCSFQSETEDSFGVCDREELVDGMTDAQLAVVRGPDRDAAAVNVPRLEVEAGTGEIAVLYLPRAICVPFKCSTCP
jgi:hypothetical protein